MTVRTIFVPTSYRMDLSSPLAAAFAIARPLQAHVDVLHVSTPPLVVTSMTPEESALALMNFDDARQASRDAIERKRKFFEQWCERNGIGHAPKDHLIGSTFARWREEEEELASSVTKWGRLADLVVVNRPRSESYASSRCFDAAVFSAGRPTLIPSDVMPTDPLRHILIAWNGSLEAMHAVAMNVDLLHAAEKVSIFCGSQDGGETSTAVDLASALRWHGIEASPIPIGGSGRSTGAALAEAARRSAASLILMGAYTHSRLHQTLLGGVTRHILSCTDLPVIMAH